LVVVLKLLWLGEVVVVADATGEKLVTAFGVKFAAAFVMCTA
jgi:hypothetical protein